MDYSGWVDEFKDSIMDRAKEIVEETHEKAGITLSGEEFDKEVDRYMDVLIRSLYPKPEIVWEETETRDKFERMLSQLYGVIMSSDMLDNCLVEREMKEYGYKILEIMSRGCNDLESLESFEQAIKLGAHAPIWVSKITLMYTNCDETLWIKMD